MKKLLLSIIATLTFLSATEAQRIIHFQEDFNSGNSSPYLTDFTIYGTPPWTIGRPIINDFTGSGIAYFNDDSVGTNSWGYNHSRLFSIPVDNSNALRSFIGFDYNMHSKSANDSLYIEIFPIAGINRSFAFIELNDTCGIWNSPGCLNNYPYARVDVTNWKDSAFRFSIAYTSGFTGTSGYVGIDNLIFYSDTSNYINSNLNSPLDNSFTPTVVSGSANWQLGGPANTFDNTPMYYFDDDALGAISTNNTVRLTSEVFDNTLTPNTFLAFDYNYNDQTSVSDSFYVEVFDGTNWVNVFTRVTDDCGPWNGPNCANGYPRASIDISSYANQNCQVRFTYHDGNDWAGFIAIDNIVVSKNAVVGVTKNDLSNVKLDIFPNPSNGTFELLGQRALLGQQYQILDISGKIVEEGRIEQINQQITLDELQNGLYFLRIPQSGITKKIVLM